MAVAPQAIALLQDQQFTPDVTRILRNMKPARQVEAVELMVTTPEGKAEKAALTGRLLRQKKEEYELLQAEFDLLQKG